MVSCVLVMVVPVLCVDSAVVTEYCELQSPAGGDQGRAEAHTEICITTFIQIKLN